MRPLIIGHRGCAGLEPENTLRAFLRAVELGVDGVEMDVHLSGDGVPMVIHDATLERTTNGRGRVGNYTAGELGKFGSAVGKKSARNGGMGENCRVPTLEEVIEAAPARVGLVIELKSAGTPAPVVELLKKHRAMQRATIISFDLGLLREVRALEKHIALGALWNRPPADAVKRAKALGAGMVDVNFRFITKRLVQRAHAEGLTCVVWTVNRAADMRRMLKLGVDGITTDFPDRAMKERDET